MVCTEFIFTGLIIEPPSYVHRILPNGSDQICTVFTGLTQDLGVFTGITPNPALLAPRLR